MCYCQENFKNTHSVNLTVVVSAQLKLVVGMWDGLRYFCGKWVPGHKKRLPGFETYSLPVTAGKRPSFSRSEWTLCAVICWSSLYNFICLLKMICILICHENFLVCFRGHRVNDRGMVYRQFFLSTNNDKLTYSAYHK